VYGLLPSCSVSLSQTQQAVSSDGGGGQINVMAADDCSWTAMPNVNFITIDAGASGTGPGVVNFTVSPNPGPPRTGAIEVSDQVLTVTQDAGCSFTRDPTNLQVKWKGGSAAITIQETGGCSWTATSDSSWITVSSGGAGSSSDAVSIRVERNPEKFQVRVGHVIVAGAPVTVTQRAK